MRAPTHVDRWEIVGELGTGGVAEVLLGRARTATDVDEVAIKRPLPERVGDESYREMLRIESRILERIDDPNVVRRIAWVEGRPPALVLERLKGRTLAEVLADKNAELTIGLALEIGVQGARALTAVHRASDDVGRPLEVVHCDVSPENLFVTTDGVIKLFDFNVACARGVELVPGAMRGRVAYMSPEQARGERLDGRADVFSLGVVIWELLSRERLFWRGNTLASLRAICDDDEPVPRVASRRASVGESLDALLATALDRDRDGRPDSATFLEQLEGLHIADVVHRDRLRALASSRGLS